MVLPAIDAAIADRGEALVADLCTGSGCVALAIAQERPARHRRRHATSRPSQSKSPRRTPRGSGLASASTVREGDLFAALPRELRRPPRRRGEQPAVRSQRRRAGPAGRGRRIRAAPRARRRAGRARRLPPHPRVTRVDWLRPGGLLGVELDERMARSAAAEAEEWYQDSQGRFGPRRARPDRRGSEARNAPDTHPGQG